MKLKILYIALCICLHKLCLSQIGVQLNVDSIPINIKHKISRKHMGFHVIGFTRIKDSLNLITYLVVMQKKNKQIDMLFTQDGKLINTEKSRFYTDDGQVQEQNYKAPFPNL